MAEGERIEAATYVIPVEVDLGDAEGQVGSFLDGIEERVGSIVERLGEISLQDPESTGPDADVPDVQESRDGGSDDRGDDGLKQAVKEMVSGMRELKQSIDELAEVMGAAASQGEL